MGLLFFCRPAVLLIGFHINVPTLGLLHARRDGKCMPCYSLLDELSSLVFVSTVFFI